MCVGQTIGSADQLFGRPRGSGSSGPSSRREPLALVVLLRGVNVGGHRTFRPTTLAKQLKHLDVVNIEVLQLFGEGGRSEGPVTTDVDSSQKNDECQRFPPAAGAARSRSSRPAEQLIRRPYRLANTHSAARRPSL